VNGFLLDANVALRATTTVSLSRAALRAIERGPTFLSVVSYWEVLIKSMKGKLAAGAPQLWWRTMLEHLAATPLPLLPDHVTEIARLPPIHSDPFDRALIAQAQLEELVLVTTDSVIGEYSNTRLRVLVSAS